MATGVLEVKRQAGDVSWLTQPASSVLACLAFRLSSWHSLFCCRGLIAHLKVTRCLQRLLCIALSNLQRQCAPGGRQGGSPSSPRLPGSLAPWLLGPGYCVSRCGLQIRMPHGELVTNRDHVSTHAMVIQHKYPFQLAMAGAMGQGHTE